MKVIYTLLMPCIVVFVIMSSSCQRENMFIDENMAGRVEISASSTSNTISLRWPKVNKANWYRIEYAAPGEPPEVVSSFQDNVNDPVRYTIFNLKPNTTYKIKVEGREERDTGSQVRGSGTKEVTTKEE
ncbi:fibronectin type III domain-containing protein [Cytophagaceae bacterium ABcell3]|nr:fibronectin type III domain-containing protein [Cytophagaceae bacterium ABcell3]